MVFDTATNQFLKRIVGFGGLDEAGRVARGRTDFWSSTTAPNFGSATHSSVRVVDLASGVIIATVRTGGRERANGMAYDPVRHVVLVAN